MRKYPLLVLGLAIILFGLSGCDHVKDAFGMNHYQADEFNICDNPPLSLPPNYDLRPPQTNTMTTTKDGQPSEKAKSVVGKPKVNSSNATEQKLLQRMSDGTQVDHNIREQVDTEAQKEPQGALEKKMDDWKRQFKKNVESASNSEPEPNTKDSL